MFYARLVDVDNVEVRSGDTALKVGTFVTITKEGLNPETIYIITRIFPDNTYELGNETQVLVGMKFFPEELSKLGSDFDIYEANKKFGTA